MKHTIRALLGAGALALLLTPAAAAAKSSKTVTVRVEGLTKTYLPATTVHVPASGWITKGGTPAHSCTAASGAGALNVASHHRWNGSWSASFDDIFLTSILGHTFGSKAPDYWSVWVNGRFAQSGICELKLHKGDQLLFAAVSDSFNGYPLILKASASQIRVGSALTVTAGYKGKNGFTPAADVKVSGGGTTVTTDKHGKATFHISKSGTLVLRASGKGYIRAAALKVTELP